MTEVEPEVQIRLCPSGAPTLDVWRAFRRIPQRGETIIDYSGPEQHGRYVVVDVDWDTAGDPFIIAHSADRPRARDALRFAEGAPS